MKVAFFTAFIFFALLTAQSEGRIFTFIDSFNDFPPPVILVVTNGDATVAPYDWWSPYYTPGNGGGEPGFGFFTTANALGGQRDSILGFESVTPSGSVALITVVGDSASVAFPLSYVGGAYFQWDGDDAAGGASAFPGATLNTSPGIGNGEAISFNDRAIDFTFGGNAAGIFIQISADHEVFYFMDAKDMAGVQYTLSFSVDPVGEEDDINFFFRFNDAGWTPPYSFTDVAAFQVRIFTFSEAQGVGQNENAIDTEFRFLQIFGYEISGTVVQDCLCDGTTDITPVENERVNLFNFGNPTVIDFVFTDASGFYVFNDQNLLVDGSYTVCLDDQLQAICPLTVSCIDIVLVDLVDSLNNDFFVTAISTMVIPADVTLECGDCTTGACLGFATLSGCGGNPVTITDFTDVTNSDGCTTTIFRTFVNPDTLASQTQTITIFDTQDPIITIAAQDRTQSCEIASTYNDWINTQAGADATDCSNFVWTPSVNSQPIRCDSETVTFTATDSCGNFATTSASYIVLDNVAPVWNPQAAPQSIDCDLKSSSNTVAVNTWVATFGGGVATDNCASSGAILFSNDFTTITPGCSSSTTVTFTANDNCGNIQNTVATFSISDNTPPTITTPPFNLDIDCGVSGGPQNALDNWLLIQGGAVATDACIADDFDLVWTNDFFGSLGQCSDSGTVTFTVTDACGLTNFATASYTLSDSSPPVFSETATNLNSQCDGLGNFNDFNAWIADNGGARATDNCGSVSFTNNNNGPPVDCGDFVDVTFTATDSCSLLSISTTARFTIVDNAPPTFVSLPQDQTSECSGTSSSQFDSWLSSNAFATITDICSSTGNFITNDFNGSTLNPGCSVVQAVRFFANDPCGNVSPAETATFSIFDTTSPVISPQASSETHECNLSTNQVDYQSFLSTRGGADATDSCTGNVIWSNDGAPISSGCSETVDVIFTANDGCGNFATTSASFSIIDTSPPTLNTPAVDLSVECNGNGNINDQTNWLNSNGGASASDTCSAVTFTNDFTGLVGTCTSSAFVTFTGCDSCAQCVSSSATYTVVDNSSPIINPQASSQTVECDPSSNTNAFDTFIANIGGAVATDVCEDDADLVWTSSFTASPFSCDSELVTFTVTDLCGRTASTSATFTIIDTIAPTINPVPASVSVECDGFGNVSDYTTFISTRSGADATDVCAFSLVWTNNGPIDGPVGCGSEIVTFTVTDECLQSASASATYTVIDSFGPNIVTPASSQTVECLDTDTNLLVLETWLGTQGGAIASDSCYGSNFSWTNNFVNLNFDGCNEFADVVFTATDPCGSFSTTSATFTITDTTPPVFTSVATNEIFECDDIANPSDISNYLNVNGNADATDSCSGVIFTNDFTDGPLECGPAVPVTFTATDSCGNFASTTGSISIDDSVEPTFSFFPLDVALGCDEDIDPATAGTPIVFDACDADITPSFTDIDFQEPDDGFCPGDLITTRTWLAIDDCGNAHQRDQIITTVFALSSGPCTPTQCPPCELDQCCEVVPDRVQCNAVPCNVVPCVTVPCDTVPCLPNVECQDIDYSDDDDDIVGPVPVPSNIPTQDCDPIYIYVFDDDETDGDGLPNVFNPPDNDSSSDASSLSVGFVIMFFALIALLF